MLIPCPSCGQSVNADAATCPGCGHPISKKEGGGSLLAFMWALLATGAGLMMIAFGLFTSMAPSDRLIALGAGAFCLVVSVPGWVLCRRS